MLDKCLTKPERAAQRKKDRKLKNYSISGEELQRIWNSELAFMPIFDSQGTGRRYTTYDIKKFLERKYLVGPNKEHLVELYI